jgi:hypothetical protein
VKPPAGVPLPTTRRDAGIRLSGYRAERVLTYLADASKLQGGTLTLGAEYGRVELMDSDDDQVRLQIRCEAMGEGAAKAIEDTQVQVHVTADQGKLAIAVGHATQGFTPAAQPCNLHIRLQVPPSGSYRVEGTAHHGGVAIRRLTVSDLRLRGRVGLKVKGIKGYIGGHDMENVVLAGDADVFTEGGTITGSLDAASSGKLVARAPMGEIRLSFTPDPRVGLNVLGTSDQGSVQVGLLGADPQAAPERGTVRRRTEGYEQKPIQVDVTATSLQGNVVVVSWM